MMDATLREFDRLWTGAGQPDLLEAALHVALIGYPDLDRAAVAARVDHLAELAAVRLADAPSEHLQLLRFNHFFFDELAFRGEQIDYYNPRNSFLNAVLDRRSGIPISLSALYMAIGQRAGLHLSGIGLPAHFVVRHEALDPAQRVYIDPFNRQLLPNHEACRRLVSRISGHEVTLDDEAFAPQPAQAIVLRMLANLKGAYVRAQDFPQAVAVLDRILLLQPDDGHQWRDRGLLHYQLGNLRQASIDLTRYLWLADDGDERQQEAAGALQRIHERMLTLN
jgi:regulator of sirC expression with transglutaminase-like and TPR domain